VPRAHQARFVDAGWDPARFLRPALDDAAAPVGPVRRRGSLSGIATGQHSVVVAGTLRRPGQKELAPVAGGLFPPREHAFYSGAPEVHAAGVRSLSAASEESWAVAGIPTAGSRSGSTVRARGTSFASPQVARALAEGVHPLPALSLKRPSTTPVLTGDGTYEADD
jgi:hypothetical protein